MLGLLVGKLVGEVGAGVVGAGVGKLFGSFVGAATGDFVGIDVGFHVSPTKVGLLVTGLFVGTLDGDDEGAVGSDVGVEVPKCSNADANE